MKQLTVLKRDDDLIVWSEGWIIAQDDPAEKASVNDSETTHRQRRVGIFGKSPYVQNCIIHLTVIYKKQNLRDARYDEGILVINDFKFAETGTAIPVLRHSKNRWLKIDFTVATRLQVQAQKH